VDRAAPLLGEHTAQILNELCYSESEREALLSKGVVQ
jgi:crotonobetainyl-CoA:carnitine CoA-transferase CaiB-like acyl-CoA transferase